MKLRLLLVLTYTAIVAASSGGKKEKNDHIDACTGWLTKFYKFPDPKCDVEKKKKQVVCLLRRPEFMETLLNCYIRMSVNFTVETQEKDMHYLTKMAMKANLTKESIKESLEAAKSLTISAPPHKSKVKEPFILSDKDIQSAFLTLKLAGMARPLSEKWGAALSSYWALIIIIRMAYYFLARFLSTTAQKTKNTGLSRIIRAYIGIPALFGRKHSNPAVFARFFTFNLPTRAMSLVVSIYFILSMLLCCVDLPLMKKGFVNFRDTKFSLEYARQVGIRSGIMCIQQFSFLWLFAGRNNFLMWVTGWSMDTYNVFHKAVGRTCTAMILIHTVGFTLRQTLRGTFANVWKVLAWRIGAVSFFFMVFNCFFGTHWFRRLHYEAFLIFHIAGAAIVLPTALYHVKLYNGGSLIYFWVTTGLWVFDRISRLARIMISGPFARAHIIAHDDAILEMTVTYSRLWKPYAGAHAYVHFVNTWFFWESHPFSIVEGEGPNEEGKLKFFCRVEKGITKRLHKKVMANGGTLETGVWIDGPYGPRRPIKSFNEVVLVAGGVGITAVYSHIREIINTMPADTLIDLYWAIPNESPITTWFQNMLKYILPSGRVLVHVFISHSDKVNRNDLEASPEAKTPEISEKPDVSPSSDGQPSAIAAVKNELNGDNSPITYADSAMEVNQFGFDVASVIKSHISQTQGSLALISCGPGTLIDAARKAVADNLNSTTHYVEYFEESFSW